MLAAGAINHVNFLEIIRHPWFVSAFAAAVSAQVLKFLIARLRTGVWDVGELTASGGMPSVHSALVSALAMAVCLTEGFDAPHAMIAVGFGLIVVIDAATLRREAGEHARLLNRIIELINMNDADRIDAHRLTEKLGHQRHEAVAGVLYGILVALAVCGIWDCWKR